MGKVAFCADIHIGNHRKFGGAFKSGVNQRCRMVLDTLEAAVKRAQEAGCSSFYVLGDLFDDSKPSPQIISEVGRIFENTDMLVFVILGNHDQVSHEPNDHALGPLRMLRNVCVIEDHYLTDYEALISFKNQSTVDLLKSTLKKHPATAHGSVKYMGVHMGVSDNDTPEWLLKNPADFITADQLARIAKKNQFTHVFAGNWHNRLEVEHNGIQIIQIGALCPTGFDNPGLDYGYVDILDTVSGNRDLLTIPGPRFLTAHFNQHWEIHTNSDKTFLRMKCRPGDMKAATAYVQDLKAKGSILDGEVVTEHEETRHAVDSAVQATNAGFTKELVKFVEELSNDPVRRAEVLAKVTEYLNKAGR